MRPLRHLIATALTCGMVLTTGALAAPADARPAAGPSHAAVTRAAGPAGVAARGAELADAASGRALWHRDPNVRRPIASITKVMTALVVIRAGHLNRKIRITSAIVAYVARNDAGHAGLRAGDVLTARQLLEGLLLPSGCDAAFALADAYGPGWHAFVAKMNATAARLGLRNTHFANFDGLPWPTPYSDYSTPRDLITLGRAAMRLVTFRRIAEQRAHYLAATGQHRAYHWRNTNLLLGAYPGAVGIKTGWTGAAGYCLLFEARRGHRTLIGVVLYTSATDATSRFTAAARLLDWGFGAAAGLRPLRRPAAGSYTD